MCCPFRAVVTNYKAKQQRGQFVTYQVIKLQFLFLNTAEIEIHNVFLPKDQVAQNVVHSHFNTTLQNILCILLKRSIFIMSLKAIT